VLAAVGVGPGRLYRAGAYFVLPLAALALVLALKVMPWAESQAQTLLKKDEQTSDLRGIKPGKFNEFSRGDVVLYAETLSEADHLLNQVFVQSRDGREVAVVVSERGYLKQTEAGENFVVLEQGKRYQGVPGRSDFTVTEFDEYGVRIEDSATDSRIKRESLPTETLWVSDLPREKAELMRRLAIPLGVLVLGILSLPLARMAPRSGVYGNVVTAFLIFVIYENLQKLSQAMVISERIPTWLGYGGSYLLMLLLATMLLALSTGGFRLPAWGRNGAGR
jgi:lipopolysaccharide export system permease protein